MFISQRIYVVRNASKIAEKENLLLLQQNYAFPLAWTTETNSLAICRHLYCILLYCMFVVVFVVVSRSPLAKQRLSFPIKT